MTKITECVMKSLVQKKGFKCDKNWATKFESGKVKVRHYDTDLLEIGVGSPRRVRRAVGFESKSDKVAVSKILDEIGVSKSKVIEVDADRGHRF